MAHNLALTNGKPAMMYTGEVPWHQLGTRLDQPATAQEAIEAAGLNYRVEMKPLQTTDGQPVSFRKATVRTDSQEILGVVGNGYVPVQNAQAFAFLDDIVADGGLRYHTAGALGHGEKIWLLAKLPGQIQVGNSSDTVDPFLLLSNSHDGSTALRVYFTPIRVVCQNTLAIAERAGQGQGVSILHKGNLQAKIRAAREVLGLAQEFYQRTSEQINLLATHYPSSTQVSDYFRELYPDPESDEPSKHTLKIRNELTRLFEHGMGHDEPGIKHTTWVAYNAVTEFIDHHQPTRGADSSSHNSRRLDSIWFGAGARIKQKAWNLAVNLANSI